MTNFDVIRAVPEDEKEELKKNLAEHLTNVAVACMLRLAKEQSLDGFLEISNFDRRNIEDSFLRFLNKEKIT